jgi:putative phosphoribosyl transferase
MPPFQDRPFQDGPFQHSNETSSGSGSDLGSNIGRPEEQRGAPRQLVTIASEGVVLNGELVVPAGASGIVVFAHGGSHHPRDRFVARALQDGGLATMSLDLLTEDEEETVGSRLRVRFADLLASRLVDATQWILKQSSHRFDIGYFGVSTGGAAALMAAARSQKDVKAVVSLGGRTDLTQNALADIAAATLLIVGSDDAPVLELNQEALAELRCEKRLAVVPGAAHAFDTPEIVAQVAELTRGWFRYYLGASTEHPETPRMTGGQQHASGG